MNHKTWIVAVLAACAALPACDGGETDGTGGAGGATTTTTTTTSGTGGSADVCGDGSISAVEACDDGDVAPGDGCDGSCAVEAGFDCQGEPSTCTPICGDGVLAGAETCDDSGTDPGDGCDGSCAVEAGFDCQGEPSTCVTTCGDGVVAGIEVCDDGGTDPGDGCDGSCAEEDGFTCVGSPSVCSPVCGDGVLLGGEQCEDGNAVAGDGCDDACMFEATCGNGIVEPGETCDDGNPVDADGCSSACQLEAGSVCGDSLDLNDPGVATFDGTSTVYSGDTTGSTNTTFGDPGCSTGTTNVPRVVHRYTVGDSPASLTIATAAIGGALGDSTVWAYLDCNDTGTEFACDDDAGPGLLSLFDTPVVPAGTTVFIVVSGYGASDVGPYELHVTETQASKVPSSGTCGATNAVGPGVYWGETMAGEPTSGDPTSACPSGAPDAVYELTLSGPADITATVFTSDGTYDMTLALSADPCGTGSEISCSDTSGSETLTGTSLAAGTYYLYVGGFDATDVGQYLLEVEQVDILANGAPCDPADTTTRCADGDECRGTPGTETCQTRIDLLLADFSVDLTPFTVFDFGADARTWLRATTGNTTGGTGGFAKVTDASGFQMDGEILASASLDATALTTVTLEFDQDFDHYSFSEDLGAVELSTDNVNWSSVASYTTDVIGHQTIDLTGYAGQPFYLRFRYDDQVNPPNGDPWANGWALDNVHVYGF